MFYLQLISFQQQFSLLNHLVTICILKYFNLENFSQDKYDFLLQIKIVLAIISLKAV